MCRPASASAALGTTLDAPETEVSEFGVSVTSGRLPPSDWPVLASHRWPGTIADTADVHPKTGDDVSVTG
jgi:hypothetical protein